MALLLVLVAALLAGLAVYAIVRWFRRYNERVRQAWGEAARRLGGVYEPKVGPWYARTSHLKADLDGQSTLIDHFTVATGETSVTYTRCAAPMDFVGDLELSIYPKGFFSRMGESLGTQDVKTGDAAFDDAFMVKASDEGRARALLTPEVRAAITQLGDYRFTLKKGELTAVIAAFETDPDRLERLARVTATVARRGQQLRRFWTDLATRRNGSVEATGRDRLRIVIDDHVPLRIETRQAEGATAIVARRMGADGERFVVQPGKGDWAIDSDDPDLTRKRISPELGARLGALGPLRIEADRDELRIVAPHLEGDAPRLAEAMALAEELAAADPRRVYR